MLRAFISALVLTVGLGPSIGSLCKAACILPTMAPSHCDEMQDRDAGPTLEGGESCDATWGLPIFIADSVRRATSIASPDALSAAPLSTAADLVGAIVSRTPSGACPLRTNRPLVTALRI